MTPEVNPNVYPTRYHVSANFGGEVSEIEFSDSFKELNLSGKLPFEQEMDETNCYCGFDPTKKNNYVGAVNYGYIQFDPNDVRNVNIVSRQYSERINYRLVIKANSSYGMEPLHDRKIRYTNNVEPLTTLENTPYTLVCSPSQTSTFTPDGFYSQVFRQYPITKIDYDKLVIYPVFQVYELSFTYDNDGDITGIVQDAQYPYQYVDIKPADKTPAGQAYDQDLWERGYKDTYEVVDGVRRLTKRVIVTNVDCMPYYGKSNRTVVGYSDFSQGWDADGNKVIPQDGQYTWYGIAPMVEIVDEITGSIFYEDIPGLVFPRHDAYGYGSLGDSFRFYPGFTGFYNNAINTMMNYPGNANTEMVLLNNDEDDIPNSYTFLTTRETNFQVDVSEQAKQRVYYLGDNGGIFAYTNTPASDYYEFSIIINRAYPMRELMSSIASLGLFIAGNSIAATQTDITSSFPNTMYHGNIDENGITDGTWVQGEDIEDLPKHEDIEYDPIKPGPPGPGPEPGPIVPPDEGDWGARVPWNVFRMGQNPFSNFELLDKAALDEFIGKLWHAPQTFWEALSASKEITANLNDYLISCRAYPIFINAGLQHHDIYLGIGGKITLINDIFTPDVVNICACGSITVSRPYGNFLDYTPYTSASIYLPFAGQFEVNPKYLYDAQLQLILWVDLTDGSGVWTLRNTTYDYPILIKQCKVGIDIPISGQDAAQKGANIINATLNTAQHAVSGFHNLLNAGAQVGGALASGGMTAGSALQAAESVVNTAMTGLSDSYNMAMANKELPYYSTGSAGAAAAEANSEPYITLRFPLSGNPANFAHTIGNLYNSTDYIRNLSGFTVCRNVDVNGITQATDKEKAKIKQILESSFYA